MTTAYSLFWWSASQQKIVFGLHWNIWWLPTVCFGGQRLNKRSYFVFTETYDDCLQSVLVVSVSTKDRVLSSLKHMMTAYSLFWWSASQQKIVFGLHWSIWWLPAVCFGGQRHNKRSYLVFTETYDDCLQSVLVVSVTTKDRIWSSLKHMMTACSLFWWSASQQKIVFGLHWNIWWLPTVCFGGQRHNKRSYLDFTETYDDCLQSVFGGQRLNKRSYLVFTETYDDCLQSVFGGQRHNKRSYLVFTETYDDWLQFVLVVSLSTKDRIWSSLKHMMTAYSLIWWSATQHKIVFCLHWNIWRLPTVCFGGQRHNKRSYLVFTETYDDCLQSVLVVSVSTKDSILSSLKHMMTAYSLFLVVSVSTKDRIWSSLKHMMTAYSLIWWSASQQKIVFCLHWNIWRLPTVCFGGQRHNKRSYLVHFIWWLPKSGLVVSVIVFDWNIWWLPTVCFGDSYSLFLSASQQKIVFCLHWNIWWLPTVCFGGQRHNKRSYLVFTETYDDCLQSVLVVSVTTKDRIWSSLKHMMTAYSLFWWSASQQKIVFGLHWNIWWLPTVCFGGQRHNKRSYGLHWNIWWLPTVCFGGQRHNKRSYLFFTETYDDCLQSVLVVSVTTKDRICSSLKHMMTAYSLFSWSASQQKIVFVLHWNIWWLPTVCFRGQRHNKRSYLVFTETYNDWLQFVLVVSLSTKDRIWSSLKHMMTAYSLIWWSASQQKIVFCLHWNIWWLPTVCFGGQRLNKRSYLVFTETYDDCLQSVLVVSVSTKDRVLSSLKHMMTAYSLFWWSASQQKIVFCLHWNIWWLPTVCFGGQRHNKRSYLVFTETYDDCLQSVLVVSVTTKDRIWSSLKHMMTAYSLFWWSASQQKIVFCLHWNIWWLPTVCFGGQRHNKRSYLVFTETYDDCLQSVLVVSVTTKDRICSSLKHMMTAYSLFWWSASQQKIVFVLHWNIWWLPTVCFGGQRHNKRSYLVFTETYDDWLQFVLVVSLSTKDRIWSSLKHMMTAYSLIWWSASQQKIVFCLHWNIWRLPTVCFGGQRHNKRSYLVFTETYDDCLQSVLVVSVSTKDRILSSLKHMMTAYSLFWWSASQQKIVFCLHWNIWWLPTVCFGGQRHNKRSYLVFTEAYDDCLQSVLVVSVTTKDRIWSSLKHMMTAYSLFWWSASQQKIVFGLHWSIWWLPAVCFGGQRHNKRSYLVFTETYDDCLQSVLVVSVTTKDRIWTSLKHMMTAYSLFLVVSVSTKDRIWLKHMMTAYSLFWWSASQQKIVFGLHWNIWWLPTVCFGGQPFNKRSYLVFAETYDDCLQSDLVVSDSTKDRVLSSLKYMTTAYSLFWWSASQQKIVFGLHWNIWWLPTVCFGGQRLNKRSYFVFTETYDDCLQSVLVVSVSTKDRVLSSLKHMMNAYSLFWWSASQQKIVFGLHWSIWWLPAVCFGGQRHNKRSYLVFTETYDECLQSVLVVSVTTKDRIWSSLKHMMTACSLFWWSASQQKIVFGLHWNIWWLPTVCFGGQRLNKRSYLVFTETYDDCLQSDLVVSVSTKDRVLSSLKYMTTAYSLFWWSASQQKIVFGLHWNIWWLPTVCFGGQRHNKRSYLVFTETYDDCLQSVLVVSVSTKDRVLSSLKHMMTAYSLFWWSASQQKIVFGLHWNIWWLPAVCFGGQRHNKRSYLVFTETYDDCLQSVLVVSVSTKDRILSSLKHMMTAYSLFWWSASQQKIVLVFTETYDDCLQSVLVVSVTTKDRICSSLKHMMTAYSLFWWSASQQKIVFVLHWNIWWLPTVCFVVSVTTKDRIWSSLKHIMIGYSLFWWSAFQQKIVFGLRWNIWWLPTVWFGGQRLNKRSCFVFTEIYDDCLQSVLVVSVTTKDRIWSSLKHMMTAYSLFWWSASQ